MNKERANIITSIVLCISVTCIVNALFLSAFCAYGLEEEFVVDAFSNKAPFDGKGKNQLSDAFSPLETIIIYSLVTYNGEPVTAMLVAFQITGPLQELQQYRTAITNQSGVATIEFNIPWSENVETTSFGKWTVWASASVGGKYAFDTLTYEVGWLINTAIRTVKPVEYPEPRVETLNFVKGSEVGLEVTLENIAMNLKDILLTIVVYDALNRPMYDGVNRFQIPHGELPTYRTFLVPKWAATGIATICVAVYDNEPSLGGKPYRPENSVNFNILLKDVAIVAAELFSTELYIGQVLQIGVVARNFGSVSESFNVTVYYDGTVIETLTIDSLEPDVEQSLSFSWNTSNVNEGVYTITASASRVSEETNITNNNYVVGQVRLIQSRAPISQRDLYILLWIILLLFLVVLLVLLVLRRGKKDESETLEQMSYFI